MLISTCLLLLSGCRQPGPEVCDDGATSLYRKADFRVGAAVDVPLLQSNAAYRNIVIRQFNVVFPANAFLLYKVHPGPGVFDFSEYDYLADFCRAYGKHLEGANLIYQLYLPDWLNRFQGSRQEWEALAKNHIQTLVSRYKGVVESWMVVNEALNEDGTLGGNIWQQHIGDRYVELFFDWAHEADPEAKLFYNDVNLETNRQKLDAALDLADALRGKGIRIDGIGLQMHNQVQFPMPEEVNSAALKVAARHFRVYYSEWDISCNLFKDKTALTEELKQRQRTLVYAMVKGYRMLPESSRYGISFWGVGDADSWIRTSFGRIDWPLLYDDDYKAKPAYCGFADALE